MSELDLAVGGTGALQTSTLRCMERLAHILPARLQRSTGRTHHLERLSVVKEDAPSELAVQRRSGSGLGTAADSTLLNGLH